MKYDIDNLKRMLIDYMIIIYITMLIILVFIEGNKFSPEEYASIEQIHSKRFLIYLLMTIAIEFFIIVIIEIKRRLNSTFVSKNEFISSPDDLIEPCLIESLIDYQTNSNNLITTCIVNLICKGNIKNIDNDQITLNSIEGINEIEKNVLDILFSNKSLDKSGLEAYVGKTVSIKSINDRIKSESNYSHFLYHRFRYIRKLIKTKLIQDNIIDKKWEFLLRITKTIGRYLIVIVLLLFPILECFMPDIGWDGTFYDIYFLGYTYDFIALGLVLLIVFANKSLKLRMFFLKILEIGLIQIVIRYTPYKLYTIILFIIAEILYIGLFRVTDFSTYTEKGKQELKKAKMFRNYLIQCSLINQRDIDGVVVYDKYLVYATAFGIPSNITRRINKYLIGINEKFKRGRSFFEGIGKEEI